MKSDKYSFLHSRTLSQNRWRALVILILGFVLTGFATFFTHKEVESKYNQEFESICNEIKIRTANRLHECEKLLRTSSAFIASSDTVSREDWKSFYVSSNYQRNLPGAQGLGYSIVIPENRLQRHINSIKKEGFPDYTVNPPGERDVYTSIIYIEPFKGHNLLAFGYDMFSDPTRRKAMEMARDSDFAVLSGNINNLKQSAKDQHSGILMVVPVYRKGMPVSTVEQRRSAIKGWVYSPYRMYTLLPGILGRWDLDQENKIHLQIYEESISDSLLLYDSLNKKTLIDINSQARTLTLPIKLNGGNWLLLFTQTNPHLSYLQDNEFFVAVSGILISILLCLLSLSLLNTRFRAQRIAEHLTFELKEREVRLLEVLENSQDASYKRNLQDNKYDYLSPVFERISGYSHNKMLTFPIETVLSLIHPDDLADVERVINEATTGEANKTCQIDYRFKHKDGEYHWFSDKFALIRDANNLPLARIGSVSDITNRKLSEESLRRSEEKYRSIFETIQDVFYQVDLDGKILEISPSIATYTDFTREELLGIQVESLYVSLIDRAIMLTTLKKDGVVRDYELKMKTKNGTIIDTSINARIIFDDRDNPNHIVGIIRDITDRKQKEEELKRSENNYRNIYNNALEGMVRTTIEGRSLGANQTLALMLGFNTPEEALRAVNEAGHQVWVDKEERSRYQALLIKQGIVRDFECQWRRKDGSIFWVTFNSRVTHENDGKDIYVDGYIQDITDRRKTIVALQESEERHRTILRTAMDGFWISDINGRILEVNDTYCHMIGYSMNELLSMSVSDVEAIESEHEVNSHIQKIITQGENIFETRHCCKDGSLIEVQISAQYQHFEGGRIVVFIHDITSRKNAEREQRKIQFLLANSQRQSNLGSWETELSTGKLIWTEEMYRIFGFPLNLPIDLEMAVTVFQSDELVRFRQAMDDAIINKVPYHIDCTIIRHNDGQMRVIHDEGEVSFDEDGKAVRMFGTTQDVTDRKESEKQLKLLSTAIAQSPISVVITDREGNIEYVNPKFSEITGYSLAEAQGRNPRILKSDLHDREFYRVLWNTILSGNLWQGEFCNKKKNGDYYWESAAISPIVDSNGYISFFVAVKEDISEKKKMMEDLIKAKEQAEESDKLKTAFLNNISHEIRTPFNGILGFLSMLQYDDLSKTERDEYFNYINQSADRLMNTINDIVDISQIQSGQTKLTISMINLRNFILNLVSRFKPEAEIKGLEFKSSIELPDHIGSVSTDSVKLTTILSNLISNAIKFTKTGSIELGLSLHNKNLQFLVKDTGIGISKDKHQFIYYRFAQVDNSNTRAFEGSGLGLAIAKEYGEMLGGKIWLESEEGKGSTFYFAFPYPEAPGKESADYIQIPKAGEDKKIPSLKILIAEDDEGSAVLLKIITSSFSTEILMARSGVEAVELCTKISDIDLVLMDIRMADMDGYEATRQIRQFNSEIVIIAQTAYALSGDRERAIGAGCNEYIAKPINKEQLITLVEKYFTTNSD